MLALAATALLLVADAPPPPFTPSRQRVWVAVGFSHDFGATYGAPDGLKTPMVGLGLRPGLSFLELRARYTYSVAPLARVDGGSERLGLASLAAVLTRELAVGGEAMDLFGGVLGLVSHGSAPGVGFGYGATLGADYLIDLGRLGLRLGPCLAVHALFYGAPGEAGAVRREAQVDLGIAVAWR